MPDVAATRWIFVKQHGDAHSCVDSLSRAPHALARRAHCARQPAVAAQAGLASTTAALQRCCTMAKCFVGDLAFDVTDGAERACLRAWRVRQAGAQRCAWRFGCG